MALIATITVVFLAFAAGIFALLRRIMVPRLISACDPEWISEFSLTKYRPMQRLLDDTDIRYLSAQKCRPEILRRLRSERRRIFRGYLRNLVADFNRLHMTGRMVLLHAGQDRPDLAAALFRQSVMFSLAVLGIECRLLLHAAGLSTVSVAGLLDAVDNMRVQVTSLSAVPAAA